MSFSDDDLKRLKEEIARIDPIFPINPNKSVKFEFSFEQFKALLARLEAHEAMSNFIAHDDPCIRNRYSAGCPTDDGGYECMYDGKWYRTRPINETPKCNCGLDEKWETWHKVAGK